MKPELERLIRQIAAQQGRHPDDVLADMVRQQVGAPAAGPAAGRAPSAPAQQHHPPGQIDPLPRTEVVPRSQGPQQFPLAPRYAGVPQPRDEAEAEVIARYLEAESGPAGVFGEGGMTGGGIFGGEPVATQGHDPAAQQRSQTAALGQAVAQALMRAQQPQRPPPAPVHYRPPRPYYPPPPQAPPPQQTVRMVERTVIYEGPAPPQQQGAPQLPPPWWPWGR